MECINKQSDTQCGNNVDELAQYHLNLLFEQKEIEILESIGFKDLWKHSQSENDQPVFKDLLATETDNKKLEIIIKLFRFIYRKQEVRKKVTKIINDNQIFDLNYVLDDGSLIDRDNMYKEYTVGQIQLVNQDCYIGEICQSRMHGYGVILKNNQMIFEGQFEDNSRHGIGFQIGQEDQNSFKYLYGLWNYGDCQGEFIRLIDKRVHNQIVFYENNQLDPQINEYIQIQSLNKFKQTLFDKIIDKHKDKKDFQEQSYGTGDIYKGQMKDGYRHGYGYYIYSSGTLVEGNWFQGKQQGHGQQYFQNGDFYEGNFDSHSRHGKGVYIFSNGNKYVGEFNHNAFEGQGIYFYNCGIIYKGSMKNYFKEGDGVLISSNKLYQYIGQFKNDSFHGKGKVVTLDSKLVVEGEFLDGVLQGKHKQEINDIINDNL